MARRKSRLVVWLAVATVAALAALAPIAFRNRARPDADKYKIAVEELRKQLAGPTIFYVSPLGDPRTTLESDEGGFTLRGAIRSDKPSLQAVAAKSPTGELVFTIHLIARPAAFGLSTKYDLVMLGVDPVR